MGLNVFMKQRISIHWMLNQATPTSMTLLIRQSIIHRRCISGHIILLTGVYPATYYSRAVFVLIMYCSVVFLIGNVSAPDGLYQATYPSLMMLIQHCIIHWGF